MKQALVNVRTLENVMVGISPDILISSSEPECLFTQSDDFLTDLFSLIPPERLIFDIDYGYNVRNRGKWDNLDWDMEGRIERVAHIVGFSKADLKKIFYQNAVTFFNL